MLASCALTLRSLRRLFRIADACPRVFSTTSTTSRRSARTARARRSTPTSSRSLATRGAFCRCHDSIEVPLEFTRNHSASAQGEPADREKTVSCAGDCWSSLLATSQHARPQTTTCQCTWRPRMPSSCRTCCSRTRRSNSLPSTMQTAPATYLRVRLSESRCLSLPFLPFPYATSTATAIVGEATPL